MRFGEHTGEGVRVITRTARRATGFEQTGWPIAKRSAIQELLPSGHLVIDTAGYWVTRPTSAARAAMQARGLGEAFAKKASETERVFIEPTTIIFPPGEWLRIDILTCTPRVD